MRKMLGPTQMSYEECGEDYIRRSFMICTSQKSNQEE
jgi:hypothetical protein